MKITVRIGAALDADLQKILYEPMAQGMGRARQRVRTESKAMFDEVGARAKEAIKAETAVRLVEERKRAQESLAYTKSRLASERQLAALERSHELAMDRDAARQRVREDERAARDSARARKEAVRDEVKTRKELEGGVRSFAGNAAGTARSLVNRGVGVAADIARGAGVSFDIASGVKKRVDLESAAMSLANAGYQDGKIGPAGIKQDPRAIMADIQRVGESYGIGQMDIAGALDKFVGKTGELQTGRDMLEEFAKTAKATGASMEDVAAAAGAISNKLGDNVANKAGVISKVMLAIAGQGKEGAVEIKDMATQMEKLTSQASKFQSNAALKGLIGNDTGANVAMLGVLSQAARKTEKGSAAQATQSAMSFVRDLTNATSIKRIGAGTIFTDKTRTQVRDPQEVIKDIISRTKGDVSKLTHLMPNQNSRAVVNAFMDPYMQAYSSTKGSAKDKDKAGREAVDKAFQTLKDATLKGETRQEAVDAALASTGTKVEQFQQKLDRVVGDMADNVIPAMMKLSKPTLGAAEGLAKLATWAANNPMLAGVGIAGVSLAKAGADAAANKVADKVVSGVAGAGALGAALVATMVIASVGALTIDKVLKDQTDAQKKRLGEDAGTLNTITELRGAAKAAAASDSPEAYARLEKAKEAASEERSRLQERLTKGREALRGDGTGRLASAANSMAAFMNVERRVGGGQTMEERAKAQEDAKNLGQLSADLQVLQQLLGGNLKVEIQNLPAFAPALSGAGVTGPG